MKRGLDNGWRTTTLAAICLVLQACGGGGDEGGAGPGPGPGSGGGGSGSGGWDEPPPRPAPPATGSTATGVFRDANVAGLEYQSGALNGVTGPDGKFDYVVGSNVTFAVGGVTLGSFRGQPLITPLHLPTDTTSSIGNQIDNRLRFLQMLDLDGDPENGIEISEATRERAAEWEQVDFTTSPAELATALAGIRADAMSADGGTHALPAADTARAHFGRTARCAYSGLYRGTYSGSDEGVFAIVTYGDGRMRGMGYSTVDEEGFLLEMTSPLLLSFTPDFSAGDGSNGASFSGEYTTPDLMDGNWSNGTGTGTFLGSRSAGDSDAVFRASGYVWPLGTALIMSFEIDSDQGISGSIIDLDPEGDGVPVALTGTLSGSDFTASAAGGQYSVTGTFDPDATPGNHQLSGTLVDNVKDRDVNLQLQACKLN